MIDTDLNHTLCQRRIQPFQGCVISQQGLVLLFFFSFNEFVSAFSGRIITHQHDKKESNQRILSSLCS